MDVNKILTDIAKYHTAAQTLQTQNTSADFIEVGVWQLRYALEAAFEAGQAAAKTASADQAKCRKILQKAGVDTTSGIPAAVQNLVVYKENTAIAAARKMLLIEAQNATILNFHRQSTNYLQMLVAAWSELDATGPAGQAAANSSRDKLLGGKK